MSDASRQSDGTGRDAFLPGLLLAIAVLGWSVFQATQLLAERNNLGNVITEQKPQMEKSQKMRAGLESIATGTARLARRGNANATIIVEQLRKRGITIDPDGPPANQASPAGDAPAAPQP